ncbi:MAG: VWA domain-containing protein [Chloroflexi bacterium]|nr:VWA domain-containing protein [Chloroflexota bacterium]
MSAARFGLGVGWAGIVLGLALGAAASARAEDPIEVTVSSVDATAFPDIRIVVTVTSAGRPLAPGAVGNVTMDEGGAAVPVANVARATDINLPVAVVLAIDTSGSMLGEKLKQAQIAAANLAGGLSGADVSAVVSFADSVRLVQPLSPDRAGTIAEINSLTAGGNTALYDAVAEGARVAAQTPIQRKVVVLLSDGEDAGKKSTRTREAALDAATKSGAVYYVIGVGEATDPAFLKALADRTGGRFLEAAGAGDVAAGYAAIADLLKGQLVVTYRSQELMQQGPRTAKVTVDSQGAQGSAGFTYTPDSRALQQPTPTAMPATVPAPVAPAATAPAPVAEKGGGQGLLLAAVAAAAAAAAAAWVFVRRRGKEDPRLPEAPPPALEFPRTGAINESGGVMLTISGTGLADGVERVVPVSVAPVTIGWDQACQVILPRLAGIAPAHVRFWRRDGRTMIHSLGGPEATLVNGSAVTWGSVGPEDRITIGPFVLQVQG